MTCIRHTTKNSPTITPASLTAMAVANAYGYPLGKDIQNQRIAIIELGGGFLSSDIFKFCDAMGVGRPKLNIWGVDGSGSSYLPSDADGEVDLDIEVIAAVCNRGLAKGNTNGIEIDVIFAPNTDAGFVDAIIYAADKLSSLPTAISISWGAPEDQWEAASITAMNTAIAHALSKNIPVYVAAGDNGSSDGDSTGTHVDFPGSSVFACSCGGTRLLLDSTGKRYSETVWDINNGNGSTGGGVSSLFTAPDFQRGVTKQSMRAVPDVAGNADPASGYQVDVDFVNQVVGGTSAVAPLYAALHTLVQSYYPAVLGDLRPTFYKIANSGGVYDVVSGSNGAYSASAGYDLCTGVGVVNGTSLLNAITQAGHAFKVRTVSDHKLGHTGESLLKLCQSELLKAR